MRSIQKVVGILHSVTKRGGRWVFLSLCVWAFSACYPSIGANGIDSPSFEFSGINAIYQAFNVPFGEVRAQLPQLRDRGYDVIQISPPQQSNPSTQWWARYQPIDFRHLDSPLGTETDLKQLIEAAHQNGQKIIVDVVLNHMANDDGNPEENAVETLHFPQFTPADFHPRSCIKDYADRTQVTQGWLNCNLPDLKTQSPHVRKIAKAYLRKLLALGADGFRLDAAKHIEPEFWREVLQVVPADKIVYGEVIGNSIAESTEYTDIFPVTDFHLLAKAIAAFSWGGDLRSLIFPHTLPGDRSVTFARNHDTAFDAHFYNFPTPRDAQLANAYLLARAEGIPIIYRDDAEEPMTKAGVLFRQTMRGQPMYFRNGTEIAPGADSPNLLWIERGGKGLAIVNKAENFFDVPVAKMPGLDPGCYRELQYGFSIAVGRGGDGAAYITQWGSLQRGGVQIGGREALFFVAADCEGLG